MSKLQDKDFTPTGLKIEGAWENDRNQDSRDLFKAIIREVYGAQDVIVAHHLAYVAAEERIEDGHQYHYEQVEEIPSADTLIFDHACAKKLWGEAHYLNVLARLAMEPPDTRDELLQSFYNHRDALGMVRSEHDRQETVAAWEQSHAIDLHAYDTDKRIDQDGK